MRSLSNAISTTCFSALHTSIVSGVFASHYPVNALANVKHRHFSVKSKIFLLIIADFFVILRSETASSFTFCPTAKVQGITLTS